MSYYILEDYDRSATRTQFQQTETAVEYAETQYYKNYLLFNSTLVNENEFWVDLANYILENGTLEGFVSSNFIYSIMNQTCSVSSISLMNLPFTSPSHSYKSIGGKGIEITVKENTIIFKKDIKEAEADLDTNLLVIHRFFEANNANSSKKITEFIANQVYG